MNRTFIVASSEFQSLVKTKAFIISLVMMPVIVGLAIGFQVFAAKRIDRDDHAFAVIDQTGVLYGPLAAAAEAHNRKVGTGPVRTGPYFLPRQVQPPGGGSTDDLLLDLSQQVRKKTLFAFVEIPASVLDTGAPTPAAIDYYTETPSYQSLPDWLETTLNAEISKRRFGQAGIDPALVAKLDTHTAVTALGLLARGADGKVEPAQKVDALGTFIAPFAVLLIMFLTVMTTAPQLVNAVIEEKMSRISEVLIASVRPFDLLMGKLLGVAGVAVLLALVYFIGAGYFAISMGRTELVQPGLAAWFVVFQLCAVLTFGAAFLAVGSACSDLKDAQSMMQPVMLFVMVPYLASFAVLQAPDSGLAVGMMYFPGAAPFIAMLRMAMQPPPPLWQILLALIESLGITFGLVWAASRIFRVGLLMQGKGANFRQMIRWVRAG